jgi:phosphatidylinositol alpha-1,6-mannosyltransferase
MSRDPASPAPKVLFVASAAWGLEGGLERFNRRLIRCLSDLVSASRLRRVMALVHFEHDEDARRYPRGISFTPGRASVPRTLMSFALMTLRWRPDVILYGVVSFAALLPVAAVLSPRSRRVLLVHGIEVWRRPSAFRRWAVSRFATEIVSVSRFTVRRMCAFYGITEDRFRILPNAVDVEVTGAVAGEAAGPALEGKHRLFTVSRLGEPDRYKNVDKVILALPVIHKSFPDTHYYVVGTGALRPELEQLARDNGVAGHVHFLGTVDDSTKEGLYAASDIFVLPSTGEGFGIVYLEAWRYGMPVICSDQDAASEVVRNGVDGFCVPPEPDRIAAPVMTLLADPARRRAMGASGQERLHERYSHERFHGTVEEILFGEKPCAG